MSRYREEHPEAYAVLGTVVTNYLKNVAAGAREQWPPHYVLLVRAHILIGNLRIEE